MPEFEQTLRRAYEFAVPSLDLGAVIRDGAVFADLPIRIPIGIMNRHGLIAGSTGTGKTRTVQLIAEGLSRAGVPSFIADVKGDMAGMAKPGVVNDKIVARMKSMNREFKPEAFPCEFFSLTGSLGTQVRATASSFGPVLLGKVLDLSETQQSVLSMVFKYCDDRKMPLLDFKDLRDVLQYLQSDGKEELKDYGGMAGATVGVLIRKMVELEQQGAGRFFGEPELDIHDLMRTDASGRGIINLLELADVQDKPRLYSTFLMWLLGQFYYDLPEVGDLEKPKLVFFFDEAHLLFEDSSAALVEQIEQVARLIRSKGIGVFFITQMPKDIDEDVLAQLGNRIQHAVRAFTPQDAKNLKASASTFPHSEFYPVSKTLTSLGIGEALITVLNPKGVPTEVAATQILAPASVMGPLDPGERDAMVRSSAVAQKYATPIDRESAQEILSKKLAAAAPPPGPVPGPEPRVPSRRRRGSSEIEKVVGAAARQAARSITREVIRGVFGVLRGSRR